MVMFNPIDCFASLHVMITYALVDLTGNLNSRYYFMVMFNPIVTQKLPYQLIDVCSNYQREWIMNNYSQTVLYNIKSWCVNFGTISLYMFTIYLNFPLIRVHMELYHGFMKLTNANVKNNLTENFWTYCQVV